jgi:hypothetical protein
MEMIAHEAISVDLPASLFPRLAQCVDKTLSILCHPGKCPRAGLHGSWRGKLRPGTGFEAFEP